MPYPKLKRARKEGRVAEALLDRRAKLKRFATLKHHLNLLTGCTLLSDRFC
jgi:hypothetical protein